jgi:predicted transcriptional regulator
MSESSICEDFTNAVIFSDEPFAEALKAAMKRMGISAKDLSEGSGIPMSTINKIISQERDLRLSTFREILRFLRSHEPSSEGDMVIAIIATRQSLDSFSKHVISVKGKKIAIKEYPASSIEDAIISAIKAEREKVSGIVCASIVASIIEKFVRMPIMTIKVGESNITESIAVLVEKIMSKA